jgi:hypothetical protein
MGRMLCICKLQGILDLYEECSEHAINKEKSAVIFSKNTESKKKAAVMQAFILTHEVQTR